MEYEKKIFFKNWYGRFLLLANYKGYLKLFISEMLSRDLLNSSKFSRFESQNTEKRRIIIKNTGNKVMKDNDWKIINKYTARKIKDLNKKRTNFKKYCEKIKIRL